MLSGNWAATLGALVAALWMLWWVAQQPKQNPSRSVGFWGGLAIPLGVARFVNGVRMWERVDQTSTDRSSLGHLRLWYNGLEGFTHHWMFGAGLGYISLATEDNVTDYGVYDPENLVLQWLAQFCIIGGILLLLSAYFVVKAVRGCSLSPSRYKRCGRRRLLWAASTRF